MLPLRASLLALALLAAALAPAVAQDAAAMPAAAAAAPAPEGMAAAAPAAENALVSQYRLSPAQVAVLEQAGLTDPDAIMVRQLNLQAGAGSWFCLSPPSRRPSMGARSHGKGEGASS